MSNNNDINEAGTEYPQSQSEVNANLLIGYAGYLSKTGNSRQLVKSFSILTFPTDTLQGFVNNGHFDTHSFTGLIGCFQAGWDFLLLGRVFVFFGLGLVWRGPVAV